MGEALKPEALPGLVSGTQGTEELHEELEKDCNDLQPEKINNKNVPAPARSEEQRAKEGNMLGAAKTTWRANLERIPPKWLRPRNTGKVFLEPKWLRICIY